MNTSPVIQISAQLANGPSIAAGSDHTADAGGPPSAFAGALKAAGAKASHRSAVSMHADDGDAGASLPPAGNQSPPDPLPQPAAAAAATLHAGGRAADRSRTERGRAGGPESAQNPLVVAQPVQAGGAAGAAAMIDGTKLPGAAPIAADRSATAPGPGDATGARAPTGAVANVVGDAPASAAALAAATTPISTAAAGAAGDAEKNAMTPDAVGAQPAVQAATETGLAARSAAAAAASAVLAADAGAAKAKAAVPSAQPRINSALTPDSTTALDSTTSPDTATTAMRATPDSVTAADAATAGLSAAVSAPLMSTVPTPSAGKTAAPAASASAAADRAVARPHQAALHPASAAIGRAAAPAAGSGSAPAGGGGTDSSVRAAAPSSSDLSSADSRAKVPVSSTPGNGAEDAAATAAAAAAVAGTQPANTSQPLNNGKFNDDNSFDSDASVGALGVGAEAAAAASIPPGRAGVRAAAGPLAALNAANATPAADAGKHAHGGFDLAALTGSAGDAAAGSTLNATASASAPADAPAPALRIHASVDSADFPQGLSDRVSWMVDNGVNGAKLQVNPPQLGPIELRISVQGDHAQVWMTTHSAVARDALESSSPKLRDMLNAQGFGQVSVDISQRSFQDRSAYTPPYQRESAPARSAAAVTPAAATAAAAPRSPLGALDAYA
ncbi:MAG TPA: flagellar hook-length control protein FliK [Steroidobacteraceae bacterium]|nr:flagellar hook-length control protein FliK [Steroidobacteraceae bacterium]